MKILILSDLHSSAKALKLLRNILDQQKIDLVLSPGDIVDHYDVNALEYIKKFLNLCRQFKVPLKVVFGNNEPEEMIGF